MNNLRVPQNPDEALAAARTRVERLENAVAALGEAELAEAQSLQNAVKSARRAAQERLVAVRVEERQAFINRAQAGLQRLKEECAEEQKQLDAAAVRLNRLKEELARTEMPASLQSQARSVLTVPEPAAELHQLRARVAELEFEREELQKKRA